MSNSVICICMFYFRHLKNTIVMVEARLRKHGRSMSHDDVFLRASFNSSAESNINFPTNLSFLKRFLPASKEELDPKSPISNPPFYRQPIYYKDLSSATDDAYLFGYSLLAVSFLSFSFVLYTIIFSKFMPVSHIQVDTPRSYLL